MADLKKALLTQFWPIFPFSTPWKHQKILWFSGVFRRYKMGTFSKNGYIYLLLYLQANFEYYSPVENLMFYKAMTYIFPVVAVLVEVADKAWWMSDDSRMLVPSVQLKVVLIKSLSLFFLLLKFGERNSFLSRNIVFL